jgi:hypothetical protein
MHSSTARTMRPYEWFVSAAIVGLAIAFIVRTIWLMDRGFDFTDESFYLAWARQPTAYDIAYGLFGYGLHPLFEIFNGSIAGFRRSRSAAQRLIDGDRQACNSSQFQQRYPSRTMSCG